MRVGVLGAGGTIAPAIVRDLAESPEADELLLVDLDLGRAEAVAGAHGLGKARAVRADARAARSGSGSLAAALDGCDVLVNSASYRVNLDAMRACLDASCHYVDLGGLYWMTSRQLDLAAEFEAAGLLGLLGMGSAPGKTNLMAARAARELDSVDEMHVSAAGRDLDPPAGFSVPYALRTLIDELTMAPVAVRGGAPAELKPMAPGGDVDFGEPIGTAPTINTLHSEMLTFPASFGCREASFRLSLAPSLLERLRELADAPEQEVERAALEAARPSAHTVSVHLVEASGAGRSVRVRCLTVPHEGWGIGGGVVSTAAPAAAAVRMLARGSIPARGVHPPEACVDPDEMFAELESRGSAFEVDVREEVAA
jgi:saccharopine dehydrogenase-like NADP-dependent oxidoreductase